MPDDIPSSPQNTYSGAGWKGLGDWLGTEVVATRLRRYRPFHRARAYARSLGLENRKEWRDFCQSDRMPRDMPADPGRTYRDQGWAGFRDWLRTGATPLG